MLNIVVTLLSFLDCHTGGHGGAFNWISNGHCNNQNNNAYCSYDGGDCCGDNVNTQYCDFTTYMCACLDPGAGGSGTTTITTGPTNQTTTGSKHW